jgi:hypothetical protein
MPLKVTRAKDREIMARKVEAVFASCNNCAVEREPMGPREIWINFRHASGLAVTITLDGDDRQDQRGEFCMAWHISGQLVDGIWQDASSKISDAFGIAMGWPVNNFHHRKCTAFSAGFDDLCNKLRTAVAMMDDGSAYR